MHASMDPARVAERFLRLCEEESPSTEDVKSILASHPDVIQYNDGEALLKACETVRADPAIDRNLIAYLLGKALERDEVDQDDMLRRFFRQLVRSSKIMVLRYLLNNANSAVFPRTSISTSSTTNLDTSSSGAVLSAAPLPSTTTASRSSSSPRWSSIINRGIVRKYSLTFVALKIDDDFDMFSTMKFLLQVDPTAISDERNGCLLIECVSAKHPVRSTYHQLQLYRLFIDLGITHGIPKAGLIRNKFLVDDNSRLHDSPFHQLLILAPQAQSCLHYLQTQTPPLLCPNDVTDYKLLYPAIKSMKIDLLKMLLDLNVKAVKTTMPLLLFPDLVDHCIQSPQQMEDWKHLMQILVEIGLELYVGGEYGLGGLLVTFDDMDISITPKLLPGYYHHWSTPFLSYSNTACAGAREDDMTMSESALKPQREEERHKGCILQSLCLKLIENNLNPYTLLSTLLFNNIFQRRRVPVLHSIIQSYIHDTSKIQFIACIPWCVTFADSTGRLPIHHAIERKESAVTQYLIEGNPSTLLVKDIIGRIPVYMIIHFISQASNEEAGEFFNVLMNIVEKEPWIFSSVVDREYGLYPFMYAASMSVAQEDTVGATGQYQDHLISSAGKIAPLDICFVLLKASAELLDRTNAPIYG